MSASPTQASLLNQELVDYITKIRRHFHKHPELSGVEFNTTERIKAELTEMGVPFHQINEITVVAHLGDASGEGAKKVALRGDTDALPIQEQVDCEFKSIHDGVMHACGHDGHTAMLLGAAKYVKSIESSLKGRIYFCFQPAEEIGQGAAEIIEYLKEEGGVDDVLGIHLWSLIPVGKICVEAGYRMASGDVFNVTVKGKGGHGSRPDQCVDPLKIASKIVLEISAIPTNRVSTLEPCVVSVGSFQSGHAPNVIPHDASISGTIRTFSPEIRELVPKLIAQISEGIAEYHGATAIAEFNYGMPSVFNHEVSATRAKGTVRKILGEEAVFEFEKLSASENFGCFTEEFPGLMAFVGAGNVDKGVVHPHHHPHFQIDEDALKNGAELYIQYALDVINEG